MWRQSKSTDWMKPLQFIHSDVRKPMYWSDLEIGILRLAFLPRVRNVVISISGDVNQKFKMGIFAYSLEERGIYEFTKDLSARGQKYVSCHSNMFFAVCTSTLKFHFNGSVYYDFQLTCFRLENAFKVSLTVINPCNVVCA